MRTRLRRVAVVAGAFALAAPLLAAPAVAAPTPEPTPVVPEGCGGASEESPVLVEVTTLLPRAPARPDQPFQVAGRLRNCGEQPLESLEVRLATGRVIATRGELQRADEEPVVGSARLSRAAELTALEPGEATTFDVRVLVEDLELGSRLGVYPLALQARARYGGDRTRTTVGLATTFVPWFPDGPPAPTRVAWLWPLVDQPRRAPAEVMLDDVLDALVAPGTDGQPRGRLQELLVAAREGSKGGCEPTAAPPEGTPRDPATPCRGDRVPLTYAVDPSMLYSIEAMDRGGGYTVLEDGEPVELPRSENAAQWLVSMRAAAQESAVLALPFGDPDVVALARAGMGDEVNQLRKLGERTTQELLWPAESSRGPLTSVAWPPPGPVTPALDDLVGGDTDAVVLDVAALPPASVSRNRTPNARTELPSPLGPVTGLVVEDVLSELVEGGRNGGQGHRLAEQRFIAETALIAADRPSESRTLVIAPRREADVVPAVAAAILADTGRLPWLCPVPLADAAAGTEQCATLPDDQPPAEPEPRADPDDEVETPDDRDGELAASFLQELAAVRRASDQFTEHVLVAGTDRQAATKARLLRARGRAASAAWRDQPVAGQRMLGLLADDVEQLRGQVTLLGEPVLLTGSSGTIELAVENRLDQAVNVGVQLDETASARLSSTGTGVQTIPAGSATPVQVRVEPRTSGRFVVRATLVDQEGRAFGEQIRLEVRSTEYGRVALAVTGIAAAVLLVAVGARITRRALRRPDGEKA